MSSIFHVDSQIQELGLQTAYQIDNGTYTYLRKVMALPFLPNGVIESMFLRLNAQATTATLQRFMEYVSETWIYSSTWFPSSWSVFMKAVQMNNVVGGWHNSLNRRTSGRCQMAFNMYLVINLLHREARLTALHVRPVCEKKLKCIQRKKPEYSPTGRNTTHNRNLQCNF